MPKKASNRESKTVDLYARAKRLARHSKTTDLHMHAVFLVGGLRGVIAKLETARGVDPWVLGSLKILHDHATELERDLRESVFAGWTRSKSAHDKKKEKKRKARPPVVNDDRALEILKEERNRKKHGYRKRAAKRTGRTLKQLDRLQATQNSPTAQAKG